MVGRTCSLSGSILVLHQEELLSGGPSLLAVKHFTCQGLVVAGVQNETNCSDFRLIRGCALLICDSDRTFLLVALVDFIELN